MLLGSEPDPKTVLRFNINAFKNSYSLADLSKMNLTYYGIKVGTCTINQFSMENEFKFEKKNNERDVTEIVTGEKEENQDELIGVLAVVLGGVGSERYYYMLRLHGEL